VDTEEAPAPAGRFVEMGTGGSLGRERGWILLAGLSPRNLIRQRGVEFALGRLSVGELNNRRLPHGNAARVLALALCVLTVFFVVISTSHIHSDDHGDGACRICQVAHIGVPAALGASELPAPLIQRSDLPCDVTFVHSELFLSSAPSRAPPSA